MSMPIISNDLRSSCRALLLQSHMKNGGETEVEWKYPEDWPELPHAGDGECILLIRPSASYKKMSIYLNTWHTDYAGEFPEYQVTIDWGDGNTDVFDNEYLSKDSRAYPQHEYSDEFVGKYLIIKIKTMYVYRPNSYSEYVTRVSTSVCGFGSKPAGTVFNVLAASVGTSLECAEISNSFNPIYTRFEMTDFNSLSTDRYYSQSSERPYSGYYREAFAVFTGQLTKRIDFTGSPEVWGSGYGGSNLSCLKTIGGADSITEINEGASYSFNYIYALDKILFPKLTVLGENMLNSSYSVREIYLPKCKKIGAGSICGHSILQKLTVAKGCEIDPAALQNNNQYVEIAEV